MSSDIFSAYERGDATLALRKRLLEKSQELANERAYSFSLQMKIDRTIYWCLASALIGAALAVIGIGWLYGNLEILFN